ncbi:MAG TPA: TetR/AcrR family transcriptional regulator [Jatrophihabitantaceae bacterium]|nr:TetR/AcrR family transcriptional regulator [Jatrophihabitantaceae bacterium]
MTATATDPRQARREAKLAQILAEAWRLARRDGLAAISLRDVAAAVGLRQPSLYVYFESKLALYDAMFADGYRQLLAYVGRRDYTGDPRKALSRLAADCVMFSSEDVVRHQLLFQRTIPGFEPGPESWALAVQFFEQSVALMHAAGVRRESDVDVFTAVISGLAHQQVANDPGGNRWVKHSGRMVEMFLADLDRRADTSTATKGRTR